MTPSLNQIQLSYSKVQDRLLLSLASTDYKEYKFWITRHATQLLWRILSEILKQDRKTPAEHAQEGQKMSEKILQEKALRQPTAEKLMQKITQMPLGPEPLLLVKISGRTDDSGSLFLHLEDVGGGWVEFKGNASTFVGLCQLILEMLKQAHWNLELTLPWLT